MGSNPIGSTRIVLIQPLILTKRILIIAALVLGLLYCADYVYVRIRMLHPKPDDPFESLKTLRLLAIPEKDGKTSYEID